MSSLSEITRCGVCKGYLSGQAMFTSECSHSFHIGCIINSVPYNNNHHQTCPVCNVLWTTNILFNTNTFNPPTKSPFGSNPQTKSPFETTSPFGFNPPTTSPFGFNPPTTSPFGSNPPMTSPFETTSPFGSNPPTKNPFETTSPFGFNPPTTSPFGFNPPTTSPFGFNPPTTSPFGSNPPMTSPFETTSPFGFNPPTTSPFGSNPPMTSPFETTSPFGFNPPTKSPFVFNPPTKSPFETTSPFGFNPNPSNISRNSFAIFPTYLTPQPLTDDEPLPTMNPTSSSDSLQKVKIKAVPERPAIASSESVSPFTVLVGIKAPSLSENAQRAPVDLVAVLDVSGSMGHSSKLTLLKQAVRFMIDNLGPNDRLSIVSFSDNARRMLPLRIMTESGRLDAKKAVDSLYVEGGTNIVDGLRLAARVLEDRLHKNPVASIIFLSDGNDTYNLRGQPSQYLHLFPATIVPTPQQEDAAFPVHSFGFGLDHDPVLMHAISDASGGTFSFIQSYEVVQDAFASCIGGLLSVVTQELRLTIRSASHGVEITSLSSGRFANRIYDQRSQGVINVGDLYADEEKEFLVDVGVPLKQKHTDEGEEETSTSLLEVTCSYKDVVTKEVVKIESDLVEIRRPKTVSAEDKVVSLEVDRQRTRVKAAESMSRAQGMAERGDLAGARAVLAKGSEKVMWSAAGQAGDGMCFGLGRDMKEMESRFASSERYEKQGRAFALSGMSSHQMQRATTRGDAAAGAPAGFGFGAPQMSSVSFGAGGAFGGGGAGTGFVTPSMFNMVNKSQQLNNNAKKY
ncbi:hypothetical protein CASFOL_006570 [Castilleja foliolosa]|uniref:Uncharacterized protein n=1 Tax=Castilleja foliolosa TaxID=1961234 RepID=A0ABD3E8T4_9LAMI